VKHKTYPDCGCKVITGFDHYCPLCRLTDQNELLAEIPTMCRRYEKRIAELELNNEGLRIIAEAARSRAEAAEAEVTRLDRVLGEMVQAASHDAQRIAELEADLKIADDMGHDLDEKLHHAEAVLREVGELSKKWHRFGMEKHWIEWANATVFNACADELRAILAKYVSQP
jgi:muconolactone delta-isomerase